MVTLTSSQSLQLPPLTGNLCHKTGHRGVCHTRGELECVWVQAPAAVVRERLHVRCAQTWACEARGQRPRTLPYQVLCLTSQMTHPPSPLPSAADWKDQVWSGKLQVVTRGKECAVKLISPNGKVFAVRHGAPSVASVTSQSHPHAPSSSSLSSSFNLPSTKNWVGLV